MVQCKNYIEIIYEFDTAFAVFAVIDEQYRFFNGNEMNLLTWNAFIAYNCIFSIDKAVCRFWLKEDVVLFKSTLLSNIGLASM